MLNFLKNWLAGKGVDPRVIAIIIYGAYIVVIIILGYLANLITKRFLLAGLSRFVKHTKSKWDDILLKNKVFNRIAHLAPVLVIYSLAPLAFPETPLLVSLIQNVAMIFLIFIVLIIADAFLNSIHDIYLTYEISRRKPIKGYLQVLKIILYFLGAIMVLSIILNKSPLVFLSGLGALTAVLMLVFKDAILGFVAGIHLATNNMIRKGDWIEMPKYGADGDVIEIALTTVKVQNFDKTITTIPTYALISDSFKNWRGMTESDGRRIKRAINIDMNTIKFCSGEMLEKFSRIHLLKDYIKRKKTELAEYNEKLNIDPTEIVNGRRLTNIGTFRVYVIEYLKNHPMIKKDMTFLVRQLAPSEHGLPLEIYVFSSDKRWVQYEAIQADIFDHLLAVVPEFGLRVFQNPTGNDFTGLMQTGDKV